MKLRTGRTPRKVKKINKARGVLIYDISGMPRSQNVSEIYTIFVERGLVLWASSGMDNYNGRDCKNVPQVVNNTRGFKVVDVSQEGFRKDTK